MKPLFNTCINLLRDGSLLVKWGIVIFSFLTPLSQYLSIRLLVVVCIIAIFSSLSSKWISDNPLRTSWDIYTYLIVLVFGSLYSEDLSTALRVIETSASFLLLTIVFLKIKTVNKKTTYLIFHSFIAGLILTYFISLTYSIINFNVYSNKSVFLFYELADAIHYQPTYLAYYLCFSITVGLYFAYYEKPVLYPFFLFGVLVFLFALLMLTGAGTAYISMLFVFSFFILKFLFEEDRTVFKKMTFIYSVLFLACMLVINHYNFNISLANQEGDYWERLSLWRSAIDANPNFLFGTGTGDYKKVMNDYYLTHNLSQFAADSFNAHNQFLHAFFSNGLFGFISVAVLLTRPLYLSVRYQNVLGILLFFSFLIYGMTEVFLGRYQGVVFFALLHQTFVHFYYSRHPTFSLKEV